MLPFLKKKRDAGLGTMLVQDRKPDETKEQSEDDGLKLAAEDLCKAVESKDYNKVAEALRAAFQILDAEPHLEGEHVDIEKENE